MATVICVLGFRIRGFQLVIIVVCTVIVVGLLVIARLGTWTPFDDKAFAYWPLLVATLTAALSLVDYVWHFATVVVPAAAAKIERPGAPA